MVTVALAGILVAVAIPSFQEIIRNNRLATQANAFVSALNLARSEAVKRSVRVTLCKSANATSCATTGGYDQGWIVFVDSNNSATVNTGEQIIRVYEAMPGGMTLTGNTNVDSYLSYTSDGLTRMISGAFQAGTITLCKSPKARQIIINSMGRVRITEASC